MTTLLFSVFYNIAVGFVKGSSPVFYPFAALSEKMLWSKIRV